MPPERKVPHLLQMPSAQGYGNPTKNSFNCGICLCFPPNRKSSGWQDRAGAASQQHHPQPGLLLSLQVAIQRLMVCHSMVTRWLQMLQAPHSHLRQDESRRDSSSNICLFFFFFKLGEPSADFYVCLIGQDRVTWPPLLQGRLRKRGTGYPGWLRPITTLPVGLSLLSGQAGVLSAGKQQSLETEETTNQVCVRYSGRPSPRPFKP